MGYSDGEAREGTSEAKATKRQARDEDRGIDHPHRPRSHQSGSTRPPRNDHKTSALNYDERDHARRNDKTSGDRDRYDARGVKRRHPDDHHKRGSQRAPREHKVHWQDSDQDSNTRATNGHDRAQPGTGPENTGSRSALVSRGEPEEEVAEQPVIDEADLIEQRRKRREALRAKHAHETPLIHKALQGATAMATAPVPSGATVLDKDDSVSQPSPRSPASPATPATPLLDSLESPAAMSVGDDSELVNHAARPASNADVENEPAAADYDPSMDMQEDRYHQQAPKHSHMGKQVSDLALAKDVKQADQMNDDDGEFDMFADDIDFDGPDTAASQANNGAADTDVTRGKQLDQRMLDDWDDAEGYYRIILGELIDKRYLIQTNLGKGVFSAVVRALDNKTGKTVAIKVIRKQETMYKAGIKEIQTLLKLAESDVDDKKHIVRLERHFMHKGHLCMVFEHLSDNLREVLKKFGRDIGISIQACRSYAYQMFLGLGHMKKCDILHADLKPDNVLVNDKRNTLKIADLGSALDMHDSEVTDVLVSRFYRAPEIMLGIKGDFALDMWSIGCTLFELYTGRICFTGASNNQMLKAIMECRGKVPNRVLKRADVTLAGQHFDMTDGTFLSHEYDEVTRKEVVRRIGLVRATPAKELRARLFAGSARNLSVAEAKELNLFADLLDKCLALDPQRRISPNEALRHGFINRAAAAAAAPAATGSGSAVAAGSAGLKGEVKAGR